MLAPAMQRLRATVPLLDDEDAPGEIDMDRVVADLEYRRHVVARLRRERLLWRTRLDSGEAPSDDED
jgi:hypothetical protein